jgi:hypothetical protein
MPPRLSALDASFLYLEEASTPMHVGGVSIFRRPKAGFDYDRLVELIEQRIALVPRYRQKVRHVPGNLARPVWIDDPDFDVAYHVRRSALPRPGTEQALHDLVARLMSRPLDHTRPLWEMYLIEGLARGRSAVLTKTHQAMVDGIHTVDIGQVILDVSATPRRTPEEIWVPRSEPGCGRLVLDAVGEMVARPGELVENVRVAAGDAVATAGKLVGGLGLLVSVARAATRPAPGSPLNVAISTQRRFAVARTRLESYRAVRAAHGCTVNDVVLSVIAGALRNWLLSRGEPVHRRQDLVEADVGLYRGRLEVRQGRLELHHLRRNSLVLVAGDLLHLPRPVDAQLAKIVQHQGSSGSVGLHPLLSQARVAHAGVENAPQRPVGESQAQCEIVRHREHALRGGRDEEGGLVDGQQGRSVGRLPGRLFGRSIRCELSRAGDRVSGIGTQEAHFTGLAVVGNLNVTVRLLT